MPLKPSEIQRALTAKQAEFTNFSQTTAATLKVYRQALTQVAQSDPGAIATQLHRITNPGARPLEPWQPAPAWRVDFPLQWDSREQSLEWVRDQIANITTFAVDGSQIYPTKDISIPVAVVQVGWFENPHATTGTYHKDVHLDVLSPVDLQPTVHNRPIDRQVSMQRFRLEVERLIEFMQTHPNRSDCLALFDGSLVASYAERFDPDCRDFYVQQSIALLSASEQYRVPLVAYVDTSAARDLVQTLQHLYHLPAAPNLHDATLLNTTLQWGDRTPLCQCDRPGDGSGPGVLQAYGEHAHSVAFTYLKTHTGPPARLELPLWLYQTHQLESVLNTVRSEVIIGSGYPYAIETADQIAVLQTEDRQLFWQVLQDWAAQHDLPLRFSRKAISKHLRRQY